MASPYARPDVAALGELERVLRLLTEELAGWRRRCLKAESELQSVKAEGGMVPGEDLLRLRERALDLERENLALQSRVDRAREMVSRMQQRLALVETGNSVEQRR